MVAKATKVARAGGLLQACGSHMTTAEAVEEELELPGASEPLAGRNEDVALV